MKRIKLIACMTMVTWLTVAITTSVEASERSEVKYALVMKALSNPFFAKMSDGAKQYAIKNNLNLEVFGVQRETDIDQQIKIVEDLIARGYQAIVIAPADSKRLLPVCKKAVDQGIVVINIDNSFDQAVMSELGVVIPFVGSDNYQGAAMVGHSMREALGGKGNVIVIEGIRGVTNADLRASGFVDAVTTDSDIQVIASESGNWHTDEAFALTVKLLGSNEQIDGIFCANDQMALGAVKAVELLDASDRIIIGGYDNIPAVRSELRRDRIYATVEQHPELMGEYGLRLATDALAGKTIAAQTSTPLDLITSDGFGRMIGVSISEQGTEFFDELTESARSMAQLLGAEVICLDAQKSDAKQLVDISELIRQDVDVLIINPTHSARVIAGIELANAADIPVIIVDRKVAGGQVACQISSDNFAGGKMAALYIATHLSGDGSVVELQGIPGTVAAIDRGNGFSEGLADFEKIRIVSQQLGNFDREQAKQAVRNLIQGGMQFDAIFAHNDLMALGAIEALQEAEVSPMPMVVGFDAIPEAIEAVREHTLSATVAQQPDRMGQMAVKTSMQLCRGDNISDEILIDLTIMGR